MLIAIEMMLQLLETHSEHKKREQSDGQGTSD
jgi:hypothetical protein